MAAPEDPKPEDPNRDKPIPGQEELDRLMAPDSGPSRDPLDALLKPDEPSPSGPAPESPPPSQDESDEVELDQATLDALIAEAGLEPSPKAETGLDEVLGPNSMDAPIEAEDSLLADDELDRLLDVSDALAPSEDTRVDPHPRDATREDEMEAPLGVSESEIDALVNDDRLPEDAVGEENRAAADEAEADALLDQSALDALIDQAVDEAKGSAPSSGDGDDLISPPEFEPDAERENVAASEPPMDPDIAAAIDLEALVVHEAAQTQKKAPSPDAVVADEAPAPRTPRKPWPTILVRLPQVSMRGALDFLNHNALRLATAISAGMVVAMGTFTLLFTNQVQQPDATELAVLAQPTLSEAIEIGRARILAGEYTDALNILSPALEREPASPLRSDAIYLRIQALHGALETYATERERLAFHGEVDEFEISFPADPRVARALAWQAEGYERDGQPYDALRNYRKIEANYPNYEDMAGVMLASARLALATNQPKDALESLENLMRTYPGSPSTGEARLLLADTYIAQGDRRRGRDLLEGIARTQTHTALGAAATARLARLAFEDGRYEDAIEMLEARRRRATTVEGNDEVYLLLASAYRDSGQTTEAERVLRELIDFFPDTPLMPQAYLALSALLERDGRREEALRLARLALDRFQNERDVVLNAADLLEKAGQASEAAELYMRAEEMERSGPGVLLRAGRAFLAANEPERALSTLAAIVDAFPGTPEGIAAGIEWARASHRAGNTQAAMERLRSLRDQTLGQPAQVPVLLTMAEIYDELGLRQPLAEIQREVAALTNEPQRLAEAAIAMIDAADYEPGFAAANRVDLDALRPDTAYALLTTHAQALLRTDPGLGIAMMEDAIERYPSQRTTDGDRMLFEAYLRTEQPALARVMLSELELQARRDPLLNERVHALAATLGDFHFQRGDYRAAMDAYTRILDAPYSDERNRGWAAFQHANALVRIQEYDDAIAAYQAIITERSEWAAEAELRLGLLQLDRRLRTGRPADEAAR